MEKYQSTKIFDGYSTVFRQWKAKDTHCQFLHGYGVSLKVWFEGKLDEKNSPGHRAIEGITEKDFVLILMLHHLLV